MKEGEEVIETGPDDEDHDPAWREGLVTGGARAEGREQAEH